MKKYNVYENTLETNLDGIQEGCTFMAVDTEPELLKSFDTKDQAIEFLKTKETVSSKVKQNLFSVTEYYLVEEEWDEEYEEFETLGDMIAASDVFPAKLSAMRKVSKIPYFVKGDTCDRSELVDAEASTSGDVAFFQVTDSEGLMFTFSPISQDGIDQIKIDAISRVKKH